MKKGMKKLITMICVFTMFVTLTGCSFLDSKINDLKGQLTGNSYQCMFYDNYGTKTMTVKGDKICMESNIIETTSVSSDGDWISNYDISSVISITIDGNRIESCGDTIIFQGKGLSPDVDFREDNIDSNANGIGDNTMVANVINKYKNYFGKSRVVVIKGQLGNPICAYSGDDVYYEVCDDLPKTTKLMIDNKPLYIHRANFQIIDMDLLK